MFFVLDWILKKNGILFAGSMSQLRDIHFSTWVNSISDLIFGQTACSDNYSITVMFRVSNIQTSPDFNTLPCPFLGDRYDWNCFLSVCLSTMVLYTFLLSKLKNDVNSQKAVDVENHWF